MKKKGKILFLIAIVFFILISFYFDSEIVRAFSLIRNNVLNDLFLGITFVSSEIIIFFFLTSLFLWNEKKARWIFPLWLSLGLSALVSFILKTTIQRQRPYELEIVTSFSLLEKTSHLLWNFSFPSFQTMLVFCAVPILSKEFPRLKYMWIVFAGLVGFSRVYFGAHFLSDVLVGGLIGYLIGVLVVKIENKKKFGEKAVKKFKRAFKR